MFELGSWNFDHYIIFLRLTFSSAEFGWVSQTCRKWFPIVQKCAVAQSGRNPQFSLNSLILCRELNEDVPNGILHFGHDERIPGLVLLNESA